MNDLDIQKEREIFEAVFGVNKVHRKVDYLFKQDVYEAHDYNKKSHQNYAKEVNLRWLGWKQAKRHTLKSNNWISVNDRLPENEQIILIYSNFWIEKTRICTSQFIDGRFLTYPSFQETVNVTHWQPLPNPPMEIEK